MSSNPFKIWDEVKGNFEVEKVTTKISHGVSNLDIKWRAEDIEVDVLTLDEILEQVKKVIPNNRTPYIKVEYESGLWGVIFQVGNYKEKGDTWIVHGVTKGYA